MNNQFTINITIIWYTGNWTAIYQYHQRIIEKCGNIERHIYLYRNLYNWALALQNRDINEKTKILTGALMNLFNNFIPYSILKFDTNPYGWRTRLSHKWRKDHNLLGNTTATPKVKIKICRLMQQLNTQIFYPPTPHPPHTHTHTGRKLNVHKTFRRCPGRLLNVLRTFNLCPVSTRYRGQREESYPTECLTSRS